MEILNKWKFNTGDFSIHWNSLPVPKKKMFLSFLLVSLFSLLIFRSSCPYPVVSVSKLVSDMSGMHHCFCHMSMLTSMRQLLLFYMYPLRLFLHQSKKYKALTRCALSVLSFPISRNVSQNKSPFFKKKKTIHS